jgi:hypothetical protein
MGLQPVGRQMAMRNIGPLQSGSPLQMGDVVALAGNVMLSFAVRAIWFHQVLQPRQ